MPDVALREARTVVVRLWFEPSERAGEEEWRGEARDVLTGRVLYFRRIEGLVEVMAELLAAGEQRED